MYQSWISVYHFVTERQAELLRAAQRARTEAVLRKAFLERLQREKEQARESAGAGCGALLDAARTLGLPRRGQGEPLRPSSASSP